MDYNLKTTDMKVGSHCRKCLENLVYQEAGFATSNPQLRDEAIRAGLAVIDATFPLDRVAAEIATQFHRVIKRTTANPDPYRQMKAQEMESARRLFAEISPRYADDLRSCVSLATLGNTIDFFKDVATVIEEMRKPVIYARDDIAELDEKLRRASRVLYLADNTGECFFDLPLVRKFREMTSVTYAVKGYPVQNDITLEELTAAGLAEEMGDVITTGSDAVGIDLPSSSAQFRAAFERADLVFAKGMGNYETLSELPLQGRIAYCLMAKCQPIADSLTVPVNSYVMVLQ